VNGGDGGGGSSSDDTTLQRRTAVALSSLASAGGRSGRYRRHLAMTAIALPDIDRSTVDELKWRVPNTSEIERRADAAIDRVLGRSRSPVWPWVALGLGIAAVIGLIAAYLTWSRRSAIGPTDDAWTDAASSSSHPAPVAGGLAAAESSVNSAPQPNEEF
jgi:hypothetical protein